MARMWKPFFSNCSMMSPTAFLATASGFTMVRVRCRVFIVARSSLVLSGCWFSLGTRSSVLDFNSQRRHQRFPDGRWRFRDSNAGRFHGLDLLRRRSLTAGNNGSSMTHTASWRCGLAGDEADYRLLHVSLHKFRRGLLGVAANLAYHDHGFGLRIAIKQVKHI